MVKTVLYQKAEGSYTPKTKDYSYFGGSGVSFELTKTTIDGYIAGKNTKGDNNGYMVEVAFNQMWPDLLQLSENLSFSSNLT